MDQLTDRPTGAVPTATGGDAVILAAPLAGWLLPLSAVPDPVFSGRLLGDGFAIDPTEATLRAPFDGVVTSLHRAHHAVTLKADSGAEILMHIGLDTVGLKGEGFTPRVAEGDRVRLGAPLIDFDMDVMAQLVRSLVVPVVLTNGDAFALSSFGTDREVARGATVVEIRQIGAGGVVVPIKTDQPTGAVVRRRVRITDPTGIHARPAGLLAAFAKTSAAAITVTLRDRHADPKSPTALMLLGAECGDEPMVEATGPGAAEAVARVVHMLGRDLGETAATQAAPEAPAAPIAPVSAALPPPPAPLAIGTALAFTGVPAAPGTAVGVSFTLVLDAPDVEEAGRGLPIEAAALAAARAKVRTALETAIAAAPGLQAEILGAHLGFLDDPDLDASADLLIADGKSAAFAWSRVIEDRVRDLRALGKPLLMERAADLLDIRRRVLLALAGRDDVAPTLPEAAIVFADDLLPSQFSALDLARVAGIVLAHGGPTSHLAILAASKAIPTVVALGADALRIPDGRVVVLDADVGRVSIDPPAAELAASRSAIASAHERAARERAKASLDCVMADGTRIEVVANLAALAGAAPAVALGAEGCGLLRSEFLFLDRATAPSEDEQFTQYQGIATALGGRPLIVRTLDAGADKKVAYADLPEGPNPALGLRGIRLGLALPELLRTQIRAILRVEPFGQTRIMLPMIATLDELRRVKAMVEAERVALGRAAPIEVGIMVEVPSVALMAERFAAEADFFSIGTNDLTQYTLAMDRLNARFAAEIDPLHPSVLRLIALAVEGARVHGRWTGVCGTLASLPLAAPVLIGLGVTELSVTAAVIPALKARIRTLTLKHCTDVARAALAADSGEAVRRLLADASPNA